MDQLDEPARILIVYYSRFGVVKRLAECIAEGARSAGSVDVRFLEVTDRSVEDIRPGKNESEMLQRRAAIVNQLHWADALIVGAPGYFGSMASPVKRLFEDCATASSPPQTDRTRPWRHFIFRDKVGAAFTSTGTPHGGNEQALHSILTMFMHLGMIIVTPGQRLPVLESEAAPYGATAVTGPEGTQGPSAPEEQWAQDLGRQVAEVTTWLKLGSWVWAGRRQRREAPNSALESGSGRAGGQETGP